MKQMLRTHDEVGMLADLTKGKSETPTMGVDYMHRGNIEYLFMGEA